MRILMISLRYPPTLGGAERAASELARGLAAVGHEVSVITSGQPGEEVRDGVVVRRVPLAGPRLGGLRFSLKAARAARRLPRSQVVVAHMASAPAAAGLVPALLWRAPLVVQPSSGGTSGGNLGLVEGRALGRLRVWLLRRAVRAWIALSPEIESHLRDRWRVPAGRIHRIPLGVDLERFEPVEPSGQRRFLYVGRLAPEKGLALLLEAWRGAGEPGRLVIVGDGREEVALRRSAPATVEFTGAMADPRRAYREADVFVLPSLREGLSSALLEAVASGLPVIATDTGAASEVLQGAGRLVPPGDVEALAAALADPPGAVPDRGRFAERYGLAAVARRHSELYARLAASSS
jgi:glycosyltransferase involved in cell wall biosynthesis